MSSAAPGTARMMNAISMLLLCGATFAVLFAALPAIVRAATDQPRSVHVARGAGRTHLYHPKASPLSAPQSHPRVREFIADDEDDGPVGDINSPPGAPSQPKLWNEADRQDHERTSGERGRTGASTRDTMEDGDSSHGRESSIRSALAGRDSILRDGPREGANSLGNVKAGDRVIVVRESGTWALIVHNGNMGWTRKSELVIQ